MTGSAVVIVADRHGVFVAETCRVDGAMVHVHGRWRTRTGQNDHEFRYSDFASYSFPAGRCMEIRWTEVTS